MYLLQLQIRKVIISNFFQILFRRGKGFFLIDLLQLRIICWENRCVILDNNQISSCDEKLAARSSSVLV
jgi:hypothetical protein